MRREYGRSHSDKGCAFCAQHGISGRFVKQASQCHSDGKIEHRIFGQKASPDGEPEQECPTPSEIIFPQPPEKIQCQAPEGEQNAIRRDDARRQNDARHQMVSDRGEKPCQVPKHPSGQQEQKHRCNRVKYGRKESDGPFRITQQCGRCVDHPSNQGRFRVIPPFQRLPPTPILRFVGIEFQRRKQGENDSYGQEACNYYDCKLAEAVCGGRIGGHDLPLRALLRDINPSAHVWLICNANQLSQWLHITLTRLSHFCNLRDLMPRKVVYSGHPTRPA